MQAFGEGPLFRLKKYNRESGRPADFHRGDRQTIFELVNDPPWLVARAQRHLALARFRNGFQAFCANDGRAAQKASEQTRGEEKKNGTILVVDDYAQHLKIYCWMLERQGYHCFPALDGSTSVDLPTSNNVCMVLLDYRLNSSLTAADVADQLKTDFPSAPIILLSELPWMPEDAQGHAKAFVRKGEPDRLMETVARFCDEP